VNKAALHRWQNLTPDGGLRRLKYSFGPGTANTLAIRLEDGTWMVVCPSRGSPAAVFEALTKDGPVSVLLAPNAYHHIGQGAWRQRFPGAVSYAPDGARARLGKKSPDISYVPIADLAKRLPSHVGVFLPDGLKSPDVLLHATAAGKTIWWLGELLPNMTTEDSIWPLRMIAPLFGSGLGYRCNSKPELVYVRDRAAWKRSIRDALEKTPPSTVVPAHGDPVTEDAARRTEEILRD
jgi:hypothetical protein